MIDFTLGELWSLLTATGQAAGPAPAETGGRITGAAPIDRTTPGCLAWMRGQTLDWPSVKAAAVLYDAAAEVRPEGPALYIPVKNPRLAFALALNRFAAPAGGPGIDAAARISPGAVIGPGCRVGAYAVIGPEVVIGADTVIHSGVKIYGPAVIGRGCVIHSGAVLGADGFGYERDETGRPVKMPHLGGIRLGDEVEIGANATIDRGTLSDTVIGDYAKIDNLCHIAHNARLGQGVMMAAQAVICGSADVGDWTWLSPGSVISDGRRVGRRAFVGLGAAVARDVPDDGAVASVPARSITGLR